MKYFISSVFFLISLFSFANPILKIDSVDFDVPSDSLLYDSIIVPEKYDNDGRLIEKVFQTSSGRVKRIERYDSTGATIVIVFNKYTTKSESHFDTNGLNYQVFYDKIGDKSEYFYSQSGAIEEMKSTRLAGIYSYKYNLKGEVVTISKVSRNDSVIDVFTFKYNSDGYKVWERYENFEKKRSYEILFSGTKKNKRVEKHELGVLTTYKNGLKFQEIHGDKNRQYIFNEKGFIIEKMEWKLGVLAYVYSYDKHGNEKEMKEYDADGNLYATYLVDEYGNYILNKEPIE